MVDGEIYLIIDQLRCEVHEVRSLVDELREFNLTERIASSEREIKTLSSKIEALQEKTQGENHDE